MSVRGSSDLHSECQLCISGRTLMVAITDEVIQVGSRARETLRCQEVINIELRLGLVDIYEFATHDRMWCTVIDVVSCFISPVALLSEKQHHFLSRDQSNGFFRYGSVL